jgi:hypothetical protein
MEKLSDRQAFEAMVLFLEGFYERTQSDQVGGLLSDMMAFAGGETADPAAWGDWLECVQKVLTSDRSFPTPLSATLRDVFSSETKKSGADAR